MIAKAFSFQLEGEQFVYHIPGSHAYEKNIDDLIAEMMSFKERLRDAFSPQISSSKFASTRINVNYKANEQLRRERQEQDERHHLEDDNMTMDHQNERNAATQQREQGQLEQAQSRTRQTSSNGTQELEVPEVMMKNDLPQNSGLYKCLMTVVI